VAKVDMIITVASTQVSEGSAKVMPVVVIIFCRAITPEKLDPQSFEELLPTD
jgi:hypothetical protein